MAEITQWEYKIISTGPSEKEKLEKDINQLGSQGWENSGTLSNSIGSGTLIFKRPKQNQQQSTDYGYSR